jgi:putative endonuclease
MTKKSEIGAKGEEMAVEHIKSKGCEILAKNYRQKFGEIDIVARAPDHTLIFIEVKTVLINELIGLTPEDNITTRKLNIVKRMANFFAAKHPELIDEDKGWRVDLIAIDLSQNGKFSIRHYENI